MSDKISHHRSRHASSEPRWPGAPSREVARRAPSRTPTRSAADLWLIVAGCIIALVGVGACGDRRIIFCDAGFDPARQGCAAGGMAGANDASTGGVGGTAAGASGAAGTLGLGGAGAGGTAGTAGSAGSPAVDAALPSDAGDALDAAMAP